MSVDATSLCPLYTSLSGRIANTCCGISQASWEREMEFALLLQYFSPPSFPGTLDSMEEGSWLAQVFGIQETEPFASRSSTQTSFTVPECYSGDMVANVKRVGDSVPLSVGKHPLCRITTQVPLTGSLRWQPQLRGQELAGLWKLTSLPIPEAPWQSSMGEPCSAIAPCCITPTAPRNQIVQVRGTNLRDFFFLKLKSQWMSLFVKHLAQSDPGL